MGRILARRVGASLAVWCLSGCGEIREIEVEPGTDGSTDGSSGGDAASDDADPPPATESGSDGSTGSPDPISACDLPVLTIPDGTSEGVVATVDVDEAGTSLAAVAMRIQHDFVGQLRVVVRHEGTTVTLVDHPGGGGCNGGGLEARFSDEADREVDNACDPADGPAINGDVKPLQALSAFADTPLQGTWELQVIDDVGDVQGHLDSWCVVMSP